MPSTVSAITRVSWFTKKALITSCSPKATNPPSKPSPKANCPAALPPSAKSPEAARYAETCDKGHGRREWRRLWVVDTDPFGTGFAGAAQLIRLERHVWEPADAPAPTITVVFGLTSRPAHRFSPAQALAAVRAHWAAIETGSHYRRDVSFNEDKSPVRNPNATTCYAALRTLAIFLYLQHRAAQRRPQTYSLPDFFRAARDHRTKTIRVLTHRYRPP